MLGSMSLGTAYLGQYYGLVAGPITPVDDFDGLTAVISGGPRLSAVISGGPRLSAVISGGVILRATLSGGSLVAARVTALPGE